MADSTMVDVNKMKVVDLRKELKTRGLPYTGDKAELVTRLQAAMAQDDTGDINLDSDEIDSDGVLEDEDDKSQTDILDDTAVDTLNEELALAEQPPAKPLEEVKVTRTLKRKITLTENTKNVEAKSDQAKETCAKKIVLNRPNSVTLTKPDEELKSEEKKIETTDSTVTNAVKVKTTDLDAKKRLEMRAIRFGLPVKMSDDERKEARKKRFGQGANISQSTVTAAPGSLSDNLGKLKKRAERFGQSVSKIMSDIEAKEKIEKRKAKFGTAQ